MTVDFVLNGPYPLLLNDLSGIFDHGAKWLEANGATEARQHLDRA